MAVSWPANGTILAIDESSNASGTYTTIGGVTSISHAGGGEVGERDTTVLSSPAKTTAPSIPDPGEMSFDLLYDPTDTVHQFIMDMKDTPVIRNFKVTYNTTGTNSYDVFGGFVKNFDGVNADDIDGSLMASVTVRVTGSITHTP